MRTTHASYLSPLLLLSAISAVVLITAAGCATKRAMRPTNGVEGDPPAGFPRGKSWYIESESNHFAPVYSCSFVEFDERGDYLDLGQERRSWQKIMELAKTNKLIVIIYCHGWKNDSQSGNVIEFNRALAKLAATDRLMTNHIRVHGLYLAWRGNVMKPWIDRNSDEFDTTTQCFGQPIVDLTQSRYLQYFTPSCVIELCSYWSRKKAAEYRVSGVPLARTIFSAANVAKRFTCTNGWTNSVFVIGHSFGALMLERSLGQACVGTLTQWPGGTTDTNTVTGLAPTLSRLPFDSILFVNSAAPSIHTKELADLLSAHTRTDRETMDEGPIILSVTSAADKATGIAHPLANSFAALYPSLQREYTEGVLLSGKSKMEIPSVPQSYFYAHTPGHNPLLVNHWITEVKGKDCDYPRDIVPPNDREKVLDANLNFTNGAPNIFFTIAPRTNMQPALVWRITENPSEKRWGQYHGFDPVKHAKYWIFRCPKSLIASHDAIWTLIALDMYTGLYRYAHAYPAAAAMKREPRPRSDHEQF